MDTQFNSDLDIPLVLWFKGLYEGSFVGFLNRLTLTGVDTYAEALTVLSNTSLIAPVYLILGGANAGDGAVLTRDDKGAVNTWTLESQLNNGSFFLLQTNYDQ